MVIVPETALGSNPVYPTASDPEKGQCSLLCNIVYNAIEENVEGPCILLKSY